MQPTPEDYAFSRLIAYAAYQWPAYQIAAHHRLIARKLEAVERGEITRLMITMPPRHGKQLAHTTPVFTPAGWTTHGDLKPGDYVYHHSGRPIKILAIGSESDQDCEISFTDGARIRCHENHEWTVYDRSRASWRTVSTRYIESQSLFGKRARFQLPEISPLVGRPVELPVEPYFLGAWLGDGKSTGSTLCGTPVDMAEIGKHISYAIGAGWTQQNTGVKYQYFKGDSLQALKKAGVLRKKHIPAIYFQAEESARRQLLAGIVDTDGSMEPNTGRIRVRFASPRLARDTAALVRGLGYRASVDYTPPDTREREICGGESWCVQWTPHDGQGGGHLPRKKSFRLRNRRRIGIKEIRRVETTRGRCIQVDAEDGIYLVGKRLTPTHNSMLASEFFPSWYLGRNPSHYIISAAYNQELADDFGRKVRDQISSEAFRAVFPGCSLKGDSKSAKRFHITQDGDDDLNGAYFAAGIGGPLTGRGAHLLLIDDPIKNREEAESETQRKNIKDWYTSTAYTRLMPGGKIVIIQTRWHGDDLSGWLLREHQHEGWTVLSLPAIAEPGDILGRVEGDPLWDAYPIASLAKIKDAIGTRDWAALYQQRPAPAEGGIFKAEWFRRYDAPRENYQRVIQSWDTAYKPGELNDPSACTTWGERADGFDLLHVYVQRIEYPDLKAKAIRHAADWGANAILIEDKASGQSLIQDLRRETQLPVIAITVASNSGNKETRASAVSAMVEAGKVSLPKQAPWLGNYEMEMMLFPNSVNFDQVDSTTQFLNWARQQANPDRLNIRRL